MIAAFLSIKEFASFQTEAVEKIRLATESGGIYVSNVKKGTAIIGASEENTKDHFAFNYFQHFSKYEYSGMFYDHDNFKLTSLVYPLLDAYKRDLKIISFDIIYHRVNPIAPKYLPLKRDIRQFANLFIKNIIFSQTHTSLKSTKIRWKSAESLLTGIIYYLKKHHPESCTIPHVISIINEYTLVEITKLLNADDEVVNLSSEFLQLANNEPTELKTLIDFLKDYFHQVSTERIFMALSKDEINLKIFSNADKHVISVVNNPLKETVYSPLLSLVLNTSMKDRKEFKKNSFLYYKESQCFYVYRLHRLFSKLRRNNVSIVYELDEKFQNDLFYGNRVSDNILSRLSYKFIGKGVSQISARYSQKMIQRVKDKANRIVKNERFGMQKLILRYSSNLSRILSNKFTKLKFGEFIGRLDDKDIITKFDTKEQQRIKPLPERVYTSKELSENYEKILKDVALIKKEI
ncbi:type IV secretory system conjugative DNA transfer family protein [Galbibacter mesophilus]|uniref:hypothetical protein n=1 Tax=Galbibacter mesophilus TaxID=379069 RepID=UPI00191E8DDC|nr:hypothetical protein [Galbibacter mesophilus]MCM5662798.1 hypothetical protein [Galbibacter mesophilus]